MRKREKEAWTKRSHRRICHEISRLVWTDWVPLSYYNAEHQVFATKLIEKFKDAIRRVR